MLFRSNEFGAQRVQIDIVQNRARSLALPEIAGESSGYTQGNLGVSQMGQANYSIALAVPPGTAGIQPDLAFLYDSGSGMGTMGAGWSLGGGSTIMRCPQTRARDGSLGTILYDSADRYCLDGEVLVVVNGDYGSDGAEYRPEHDPSTRVISHGSFVDQDGVHTGPEYFVVQDKAGLTHTYGQAHSTQHSRVGHGDAGVPVKWSVDHVQDTLGNYKIGRAHV